MRARRSRAASALRQILDQPQLAVPEGLAPAGELRHGLGHDLASDDEAEECAAKLESFFEAGADAVALFPLPFGREQEMLTLAAEEVLPLVR